MVGFLRLVSLVLYCLVVLVLDFGFGFDCVCFCCFVLIFGGLDLWFVSKRVWVCCCVCKIWYLCYF